MNSLLLLFLSLSMLLLPSLLRPRGPSGRSTKPEIHGFLSFSWWVNAAYCGFWHRLESNEIAPLPEQGPAILIANHTCGIDHMLLQAKSRRVLGFMIAQEYYDFWPCHLFCKLIGCIPVKRDGRDLSATRAALRALEQGRVLPIFPEGKILPTSGEQIGEIKSGAAFLAVHSKAPVIPAYIRGTPRTNLIGQSLYTPSHARILFGPPVDFSDLDFEALGDKKAILAVTERMREVLHQLQAESAKTPTDEEAA
ncbi:MAG: acyl-phosphate glycerol 3-phosphate acyltransferase [Planctomycetes bacterium SCN 63-9]|nr:MAG: acyl-phosphate glycerol 3-phosphate acyltransferase [Planctomycetes bacterium SCN 63-9]